MRSPPPSDPAIVVLYDDTCPLCRGTVAFARRRDPRHRLEFTPLESTRAGALLLAHGVDPEQVDSVVLCEQGRLTLRSTAVLRLTRYLTPPWPILAAALILPRPLRDWLYDWVARHRRRSPQT